MDDWGEIIFLLYAGWAAYQFGYARGARANSADAKVLELGQWLADAIVGVREGHKFTGDGIVTTSKGRAKLANGETYVVTVEMERR